jgi:hypothetical protein
MVDFALVTTLMDRGDIVSDVVPRGADIYKQAQTLVPE